MNYASSALCRGAIPLAALLTFVDASAQSFRDLDGHTAAVKSLEFSADSSRLVTVAIDGHVKIWDVARGEEIAALKDSRLDTRCAQFSPDGKMLATGHRESVAILWDLQTGLARRSLPKSGPRDLFGEGEGHIGSVNSVAFTADGRRLATGSDDTSVKIWDVAAGNEIVTLAGHRSNVCKVSFQDRARLLASGSMDGTLILWSMENWKPRHRIRVAAGHSRPVDMDFQFSPDGESIAVCSNDEIKLYDTDSGALLRSFGQGTSVAFQRDGTHIARGLGVGEVQLLELPNGTPFQTLADRPGRQTCLAFSPDGKSLAVGNATNGVIKLWDLRNLDSGAASAAVSVTDKRAQLSDRGATKTNLVEVPTLDSDNPQYFENRPILHFDVARSLLFGEEVVTIARKVDGRVLTKLKQTHSPVWCPKGERFAYFRESERGGRDSLWVTNLDGESEELLTASENQFLRWHPAWSPDGTQLAVLSVQVTNKNVDQDDDVKFEVLVIDSANGVVERRSAFPAGVIEPAPLSPPSVFKWSPTGKYLLISWESSVVVDLKRNRPIQITDDYSVAEWSPDGESVLFFRFSEQDTPRGRLKGLYRRNLNEDSDQLIADAMTLSKNNLLEVPGMFKLKLILSASGRYLAVVAGAIRENARVTEIRVYRWGEQSEFELDSPIRTWSLDSELPVHLQWSPDDTHLAAIMMKDWSDLTVETLSLSNGLRTRVSDIKYDPRAEGVGGLDFIGFGKLLSWTD